MLSIPDARPPGATADPDTVITDTAAAPDALFAGKPLDRRIAEGARARRRWLPLHGDAIWIERTDGAGDHHRGTTVRLSVPSTGGTHG